MPHNAATLMGNHACSYYCRAGLHCEVAYTGIELSARSALLHIGDAYYQAYGIIVDWVEPAREAGRLHENSGYQVLAGDAPVDDYAYLVWWRVMEDVTS